MTDYYVVWAIAFAVFILTSIWVGRACVPLLCDPTPRQVIEFLPVEIVAIAITSIVLFYTVGGGFGPGVILLLPIIIVAPISLLLSAFRLLEILIHLIFKKGSCSRSDALAIVMYGTLAPAFLIAPLLGSFQIAAICDGIDRQGGEKIALALAAYKRDLGSYPDQIASLVPGHIDTLPFNICSLPYALMDFGRSRYHIKSCPGGGAALTVWTVSGGIGQTYDLATSEWRYYDFSEPECNPPESNK